LTIIINDAPYGNEKSWNALRLASTSTNQELGNTVKIFLMGDAVLAAKKGQKTPDGYYNMEKMLVSLMQRSVEIKVCGSCIAARGITTEDLVEGVEKGSMNILATWIRESKNTVSF